MSAGHEPREQQPFDSRGKPSVRLIFSYDDDVVRLESKQYVSMVAPASEPVDERTRAGFWTEVRDAQGSVVHRRTLHNPVRRYVEVFHLDLQQPITHVPVQRPEGAFAVLVPLPPDADHVALMGPAPAGTASASMAGSTASVELHRVSLVEDPS